MKNCPRELKLLTYFSLVRLILEYGAPIWDPYRVGEIHDLEMVQRRAARFVMNDYEYDSSPTKMLQELDWPELEVRRRELRLALFYKIVHGDVAVPTEGLLIKADTRTRSQHSYKFRHLRANIDSYRHSFFPPTIRDWEQLPSDTVDSKTVDTFKEHLKKARVTNPKQD